MRDRGDRKGGWLSGGLTALAGVAMVVLALILLQVLDGGGRLASATRSTPAGSVASARSPGWNAVFTEGFESPIGPDWSVIPAEAGADSAAVWGTSTFTAASGTRSAWSAARGELTGETYVDGIDTWLVSAPIPLGGFASDIWGAELRFAWWLDTVSGAPRWEGALRTQSVERVSSAPSRGDWFGWAVLTDTNDLESGQWTYVSGATGGWVDGWVPLDRFLPVDDGLTNTVHVAFHFVSDEDGRVGRGAFVDDVALRVNRGYQLALPVILRDVGAPWEMPVEDLVVNGSFEADWGDEASHRVKIFPVGDEPYIAELGEFHTPPGWLSWFRHDPGTWDQPEVGDIRDEHAPYRVRSGEKAAKLFTFFRQHDAGFMQQVDVEPGTPLTLTAYAHAWSNHPIEGYEDCDDDPRCSTGVGTGGHFLLPDDIPPLNGDSWNDAIGNFAFMLGIDPTGGTDPFADTVEWGTRAYIYNAYHAVPSVTTVVEAETATIFLRSRTLWPFKHNDAYWDDVHLLGVRGAPRPTPEPTPKPSPSPTPEPTPSPTPGPIEWHYPVITEGAKIGVHAIRSNQVRSFAQKLVDAGASFPVVKAVDDFGWVFEVAEESPDTLFLGRRVWTGEGCGGVERNGYDYQNQAQAAVSIILSVIDANPGLEDVIDYWEPYNEPDPPGAEGYRRLAELMKVTMHVAEEHDLKLALFSLNTGTPEWDEMEAMVETGVFARAREGGHIMAVHEGTLYTHNPRVGWPSSIPGAPPVEGAGALNFRYRYLYHLLEQRGEVVPLVVTEWYCGDEQTASTQTLVDAMAWYDSEASEDYYAWGACPFTLGPTGQWSHTDYERVYEGGLVDYMITVRDRQNALPPASSWWEKWLWQLRRSFFD